MAIRSGIGAQLGLAAETTYGTYVAPTRTLEFVSEGLQVTRERINSAALRKGSTVRRKGRWTDNNKGGGGPLNFELSNKGFGLLLKHAMGNVAITTPGGSTLARKHAHTFGDLDNLSLTIQKGVPETDTGTVRPFNFLGCTITEWELSVDVDGLVMANFTVDAQSMERTSALAATAFPANDELFNYQQVAVTLDGGAVLPTSCSFSVSHGMATSRYFVQRSTLKKRPVIADMRDVRGTMTLEFATDAEVTKFLAAAPGAEVPLTWSARGDLIDGTTYFGLDVTATAIRLDGEIPVVQGPDIITVTVPFEVLDDSTNPPLAVDYFTTDVAS